VSEGGGFDKNLGPLMAALAGGDGMARKDARERLVALGKPAVSSLAKALKKSKVAQLRWEAAKALGEIGSRRSIPVLVQALEDRDRDVAWLAAEALRKFGKKAWPELLRALLEGGSSSALLRQGLHHVLVAQQEAGYEELLAVLVKELESNAIREAALVAAREMLSSVTKLCSTPLPHPRAKRGR
jgi:HEAT repeat protein